MGLNAANVLHVSMCLKSLNFESLDGFVFQISIAIRI